MPSLKTLFSIHYYTSPGQEIYICGSSSKLGLWNHNKALQLSYSNNGIWTAEIDLNTKEKLVSYKYLLKDNQGNVIWENGANRLVDLTNLKSAKLVLDDCWQTIRSAEASLQTSAFKGLLMQRVSKQNKKSSSAKSLIRFKISVSRISRDYAVCLLGNQKKLGNWNETSPLLLNYNAETDIWWVDVPCTGITAPIEYKYGIYNTTQKEIDILECGNNRQINNIEHVKNGGIYQKTDRDFCYPNANWKGAGASVPVFSLRTENGFGVGEFNDVLDFIDWAKSIGLKMIQLLPVNETITNHGWLDSYPYKSISVYALHPIYLNLAKLGTLNNKKILAEYQQHQLRLNREEKVLFPEVLQLKSKYFKIFFDQEKDSFFDLPDYKIFFANNKDWLEPYAAFVYLRDKMKSADFRVWADHSKYNKSKIQKLCSPSNKAWDDISIHYFIQYHLHKQLKEVTDYARENNIVLKGDIPIGISPNSVEAWSEPHLFNLDAQAGAPPDDFAIKGQNWGFPTYRWENMAKENYNWWKSRLQNMAQYFDAYRIDHILGFFRIWEIPTHAVEGLLGYFNPAIPYSATDIENQGIPFHFDRMVKPYIKRHYLENLFGDRTEQIIDEFLIEKTDFSFELKEEFNTQQKVNQHFLDGIVEEDLDDINRQIRDGLFELIANVLFVQTGENQWHPRITLQSTNSYCELDQSIRTKLDSLYIEYFFRRHDDFWKEQGMEKLPAIISASNMLVCGEDLGMVPDCVPPVMNQLNILSLEIQRMSKDPEKKYAHPADAPYMSVCTTSTHDMSTIRGWWEENRNDMQEFFIHELGNYGEPPFFAEPWICEQVIVQHLYSPAMWTTFPIQDLLAIDGELRWDETHSEQINEPSNVRHKWRFRMKQSIKELMEATSFNEHLKQLIKQSGRNSDY